MRDRLSINTLIGLLAAYIAAVLLAAAVFGGYEGRVAAAVVGGCVLLGYAAGEFWA